MYRLTLLALFLCLVMGIAQAGTLKINFQSNGASIPEGYFPDYGMAFGDRGNGFSYGWDVDNTANARDRNNIGAQDQRYDTNNNFHLINVDNFDRIWEVALPNGTYNVFMVCGDVSYTDQVNTMDVEDDIVVDPDGQDNFDQYTLNVEVTDGRLTIKPAPGSINSKICFIDITSNLLDQFFTKATNPSPADGVESVEFQFGRTAPPGATAKLVWKEGTTAVAHNVYFGTSPDLGPDDLVSANQTTTTYWHMEAIESGVTCFWRIDEVEADGVTIHEGDVWSFSTLSMKAWKPQPADESENVLVDVLLNWKPGDSSALLKHALYFSKDFNDVNESAVAANKGIFQVPGYYPGILEADTTYYWRVDQVEPIGIIRRGNIWRFTTAPPGPGAILREWWFGIDGKTVSNLTSNVRYPSYPDGREFISIMQNPPNWADQYGARLRGWLYVPQTGDYTFTIEAKDEGMVLLSTDEDPANAVIIVRPPVVTYECPPNWAQSLPISLEAGKRYYIEGLMKEGTINDVLTVLWQGPGIAKQIISADYIGPTPYLPMIAYRPSPCDGAVDTSQSLLLTWTAGAMANQHKVYFGRDADAVVSGDTSAYQGQTTDTSFDPGPLDWGVTYYWRVDQVNDLEAESPWTGHLWSFTTANFIIVDNFENYDDDVDSGTTIQQTWIDGAANGTSSVIGYPNIYDIPPSEAGFVRSGNQSLAVAFYNNYEPWYSEVFREFSPVQDWSVQGMKALSIWYWMAQEDTSQSANGPDNLYITVEDAVGDSTTVINFDTEAVLMSDLLNSETLPVIEWIEWKIPLDELADVDVNQIAKLTIGVGDPINPRPARSGYLFIDEINVKPLKADFDRSGRVDFLDFARFSSAWSAVSSDDHFDPVCDIDTPTNGKITLEDLQMLLSEWLAE